MRCTLWIALLIHRALADDAAYSDATVARFRSDAACAVVAGDPSPSRCCPSYALAASDVRGGVANFDALWIEAIPKAAWTTDDELDAEGVPKSFRETMKQVALMLDDDELLNNAKSSIHDGQHSTSFSDIHAKFFAHPAARQSLAHQPLRAEPAARAPGQRRLLPRAATGHVGRHRPPPPSAFDPPSGGYFPRRGPGTGSRRRRAPTAGSGAAATAQQLNSAPPFQSQLAPAASRDYSAPSSTPTSSRAEAAPAPLQQVGGACRRRAAVGPRPQFRARRASGAGCADRAGRP
ncbi:hypothetical protein JL720_16324 [Aureococcus anophagefferens]|nr:hypothetical protein JL720_16324 [Aureococcus anophagefferens]